MQRCVRALGLPAIRCRLWTARSRQSLRCDLLSLAPDQRDEVIRVDSRNIQMDMPVAYYGAIAHIPQINTRDLEGLVATLRLARLVALEKEINGIPAVVLQLQESVTSHNCLIDDSVAVKAALQLFADPRRFRFDAQGLAQGVDETIVPMARRVALLVQPAFDDNEFPFPVHSVCDR